MPGRKYGLNLYKRENRKAVQPERSVDLVVDDIVTVPETIGLQVDSGDVEELVEELPEELFKEELQQLLAELREWQLSFLKRKGNIHNQRSKVLLKSRKS